MNRKFKSKLITVILIFLAFISGSIYESVSSFFEDKPNYNLENVILVSRSPAWKYQHGFYIAAVLTMKIKDGFQVYCKVHVGNHNYFQHVPLGKASSITEAYINWGKVVWTDKELIIGSSSVTPVVVSRSEIERHR